MVCAHDHEGIFQMLMQNTQLTTLSVTCNKFGESGGKLLQEGMEECKTLVYFDLRLTGISQESEYCINRIVKNNLDASRTKLVCNTSHN